MQLPRNGSGVYSLPVSYEATTGQTAAASQHNDPLEDIKDDLNAARPVVAGGTGATNTSAARTNLGLDAISDSRIKTTVPIVDDTDTTKKFKFDLTGIATGTTRVWAVPNSGDTFVGLDATQTLTNKTLTSPTINTGTLATPTTSGVVTFGGATLNIQIDDGELGWGGGADYITWVSTEGLEGYENNVRKWRIGSGLETIIESVYAATTASAANVVVSASGNIRRSTSSGKFKIDRQPVSADRFMDLAATSYVSTHAADNKKRFLGFIAEDVAKAFPEASVDGGNDYDTRAVLAVLWTKTQEQERRIGALERRLNAIEEG